ncbi:MAG TPA: GIY-YIG nuclease family protein [Cyclobacteriaceae bacterium]|jgi:putative endonuclease|nr:GIY-YIG nuclease family protein [Cyclobacteriaceae bacterium]
MDKVYSTYIIESEKTENWYYGHSDNLERRLNEHNSGQTKSTRGKGPWRLIFERPFATKLDANRFELKLKKLKNKEYIKRNYNEFFFGV